MCFLRSTSILTLLIILQGCSEEQRVKTYSRVEQVKQLPFRSLNVTDSLSNELLEVGHYLWDLFEKSAIEEGLIILIDEESNKLEIVDIQIQEISDMRRENSELWRGREIVLSALLYKSSSVGVHSREIREFYVIEIEHERLTGTFFIFISLDGSEFSSSYVDRN